MIIRYDFINDVIVSGTTVPHLLIFIIKVKDIIYDLISILIKL